MEKFQFAVEYSDSYIMSALEVLGNDEWTPVETFSDKCAYFIHNVITCYSSIISQPD